MTSSGRHFPDYLASYPEAWLPLHPLIDNIRTDATGFVANNNNMANKCQTGRPMPPSQG